jgi:NADH:ubiquinone oxidoreductase subunit F (NADH-binding)
VTRSAVVRTAGGTMSRLLPGGPADRTLAGHVARHGHRPSCAGERRRSELIDEVELAGLAGRGGAGFPTAAKLRALAAAWPVPVVIGNGVEGEPASDKDKVLLAVAPHLVLDGAIGAAELTGARQVVIVAHPAVRDIVDHAVGERRRARWDPVPVRVMTAAGTFIAGEASAVVHWVERGVAAPTGRPARLGAGGRGGHSSRAALVQNVETLAHLALILRHGAAWFGSAGAPGEPGSRLITMLGAVRRPGVYEIETGTPVSELIELAGGAVAPPGALLIGGYFGTWAEVPAALPLPFSSAGLAPAGASPGAGMIAVLPRTACGLRETARITRYLARSSAGQCGPCVLGLDAIAGQLERLAAGDATDLALVHRWLGQVTGRGACRHPDGTALMVASALRVFRAEADRHGRGWCSATGTRAVLPVPGEVQR